jgi:hypothetical protein
MPGHKYNALSLFLGLLCKLQPLYLKIVLPVTAVNYLWQLNKIDPNQSKMQIGTSYYLPYLKV